MRGLFAVAAGAIVIGFYLGWRAYPITLPTDLFEVRGLTPGEIAGLKSALAQADVSKNSGTHGGIRALGFFSLDCGGLPVASVWSFDEATRIEIAKDARKRFGSAEPAFQLLRSSVKSHGGRAIEVRSAPLTNWEKFVLRYRDGKDPDIGC